ncbi:hypothetical protein ARMGADRAFT_1039576 [Armillaria gallica]|uniref:Uncharacterized protein n=1 Tax=Armillaria gallica TaxID=47427 RepID=A0A2H3CDD1_ARMGA|nr:hypothetical protein ARMGADRAFT_1039576 [Armillaria gallica]
MTYYVGTVIFPYLLMATRDEVGLFENLYLHVAAPSPMISEAQENDFVLTVGPRGSQEIPARLGFSSRRGISGRLTTRHYHTYKTPISATGSMGALSTRVKYASLEHPTCDRLNMDFPWHGSITVTDHGSESCVYRLSLMRFSNPYEKIWAGLHNGTQVLEADILINKSLLMGVGSFMYSQLEPYGSSLAVVDAHGAIRSLQASWTSILIWPWLGSLDGLNTHNDAYTLSIAGVTTALMLPDSANYIDMPAVKIPVSYFINIGVYIHCYEAVDLDDMVRVWTEQGDSLSPTTAALSANSLPPTNMKKYPDFECNADKDQLEGEDVSMLDGDNAPPEALPDIQCEGADGPTSQSSQWEGDAVYKDVITNH